MGVGDARHTTVATHMTFRSILHRSFASLRTLERIEELNKKNGHVSDTLIPRSINIIVSRRGLSNVSLIKNMAPALQGGERVNDLAGPPSPPGH